MGFKDGVLRQAWVLVAIAGLLLPTLITSARADEEPAKAAATEEAPAEAEAVPADETPALPAEIPTPATDDETPNGLRQSLVAPTVAASDEGEAAEPESDEDSNIFTEWWFWAAAAAVVGGTVAVGILASQPSDKPARGCMTGYLCFGDGRE
jgi:hypothetical protein